MDINKTNTTTQILLYITLIAILVILIFAFIILYKNGLQFSSKSITTLLGVIISCASLIITAYFVVMAINAYGHIEKFEELEKKVTATSERIQTHRNENNESLYAITESLYAIADDTKNKNLKRKLELHEYRLAYISPESYDEETRIKYLLNLANLGYALDIKPIEKISKNRRESKRIRKTAKEVVKELRRRFPNA